MDRTVLPDAEYARAFPPAIRKKMAKRIAFKKRLDRTERLKLPPHIWLAFLTPDSAPIPTGKTAYAKAHNLAAQARAMLKTPARLEKDRGSSASDRATLALLEILIGLETKTPPFRRTTYERWLAIADHFGLWRLRYAIEDATFRAFDPENYALFESVIARQMRLDAGFVSNVRAILEHAFSKAEIRSCAIENRTKNVYGAFRKIALKGKNVNDLYDIHGFRILCEKQDDCYKALEVLHALWPHFRERKKDYIRHPKPNGYQSVHTVVSCLGRKPTEFQIRTREMDIVASVGAANHAGYKRSARAIDEKT